MVDTLYQPQLVIGRIWLPSTAGGLGEQPQSLWIEISLQGWGHWVSGAGPEKPLFVGENCNNFGMTAQLQEIYKKTWGMFHLNMILREKIRVFFCKTPSRDKPGSHCGSLGRTSSAMRLTWILLTHWFFPCGWGWIWNSFLWPKRQGFFCWYYPAIQLGFSFNLGFSAVKRVSISKVLCATEALVDLSGKCMCTSLRRETFH